VADPRTTPEAKEKRAESHLAKLLKGSRQELPKLVQLAIATAPGKAPVHVEAQLMVLSCTEIQWCHAHAHHRFTEVLKVAPAELENRQLFQDEVITQVLARALRTVEDIEKPLATGADDLRDLTTADERAAAFELYYDYQQSVDPARTGMSEPLAREIEELLKKKDASRLGDFGSSLLVSWLIFMDERRLISPIPKSGSTASSSPPPETH